MHLAQFLPILRARWRAVAITWGAVVAAALAISLALPPRYEATATLLVDMNGADPLAAQGVFRPAGTLSTHMATQVDILKSEEVALGAVRIAGLDRQAEWQEKWRKSTGGEGSYESWLAARVLRGLDLRPSRDSNVLTVGYTSRDANLSAALANAFVRSYVDTTLRLKVEPAKEYNTFFAERAKGLRDALDAAKARLSAYEKQSGVLIGEDDAETARLAELTTQLVTLQDAVAEAANTRKQAAASPRDMREVRNDPEVAALTAEAVRLEGHLAELRADFGERHHAVVQTQRSLADVRQRLEAAMRRAIGSFDAPVKVTQARLAEAQAAVERQRTLVLKRKSQRDAAAALLRDVENAQRAYDAVLSRASQTALESANKTQATVAVLKSATPPVWSALFLAINASVAAVLGLLLGVWRALAAEGRDRRLRSVTDVTQRLRQPLLLLLPDGRRLSLAR
ncbi:MAG TPA: Wzz/FepE/Etk N-terminal domain-containing protein [Burkholderiales bacterium]|nr:Wzz/FepE/Etk N-terminal domain-containing protein [Burkholderiales bacterium]